MEICRGRPVADRSQLCGIGACLNSVATSRPALMSDCLHSARTPARPYARAPRACAAPMSVSRSTSCPVAASRGGSASQARAVSMDEPWNEVLGEGHCTALRLPQLVLGQGSMLLGLRPRARAGSESCRWAA